MLSKICHFTSKKTLFTWNISFYNQKNIQVCKNYVIIKPQKFSLTFLIMQPANDLILLNIIISPNEVFGAVMVLASPLLPLPPLPRPPVDPDDVNALTR